ncbi:hypothetical protein OAG68_02260 [bacterium]|nr:hypothetical protein [bacterium]
MATHKPVDEYRGYDIYRESVEGEAQLFQVLVESVDKSLNHYRFGTVTEAKQAIDDHLLDPNETTQK